jgi:hypothetical protein
MHSVCSSRRMESFVLWSLKVWPARRLNNFISAASILRLCEAVRVQFMTETNKGNKSVRLVDLAHTHTHTHTHTHIEGHYATSRKVAGSIPDGVIGIFH